LSSGFGFFLDRFGFESEPTAFFDPTLLEVVFFTDAVLDAERCRGFFVAAGCGEISVEETVSAESGEGGMVEGEAAGSLRGSVACSS
jgi:hypothetical protein